MKHVTKLCVTCCLLFLACMPIMAQQQLRLISGIVTDESGEPLTGARIFDITSKNGAVADADGKFALKITPESKLRISFVGFNDMILSGKDLKPDMVIVLNTDSKVLDELVVVGYGTQKKVNLTGAVASVSSSDLEGKPVMNVVEALQGTASGLVIQQSNSAPGSRPSINIRGLNTMNDNSPMVLIDGIIGDIQNVNPSDIESISVLKDASSTAIYGSRASNGVILITTKKGSTEKNEIAYDMKFGWQTPTFLPKIVDSWVYAEMRNEALLNSGYHTAFTPEEIENYRNGGPNCNWMDEIYKNKATQQSHNISFSGGRGNTTFMLSLGYVDQNSLFKGPDYGMERYNARLNLAHKVSDILRFNTSVAYARNEVKDHAYWTEWIIEQATRMPAIYPIKDEEGNYTYPSGSNSNALARLEKGGYRQNSNDDVSATLNAELRIWDGLKLKGMIGGQLYNNRTHENRKAISDPASGDVENRMTEYFARSLNLTANVMLAYDRTFGKHTLGAMLGYSYEGGSDKRFDTYRLTDTADFDIMVGSKTSNVGNSGGGSDWSIYSGFARLNYNYDEKYLFEFNLRDDASSKFAKGNRSALFPSFSLGWRISEEKFFKKAKKYVSSLKVRTSWGLVGNNRIGDYQYLSSVSVTPAYSFGNKIVNGASFAAVNTGIRWETTAMYDLGVDIGMFNNSLNITADFFNNLTRDILIQLPVPGVFGGGNPVQNAGKVRNTGWEVNLSYRFKTGTVEHFISGNISDAVNEVVDTHGVEWINGADVNTIIKEGYAINSYYAYRCNGIFQNEKEVSAGPWLAGVTPKPGDLRYVDKNNDGLIKESDDRFILGDNFPHNTYGFSYGFTWKGIDFSMFWQGVGRRNVWLRGESVEAFHNNNEGPVFDFHLDRWTPDNPDASYPRLTVGAESTNNAAKSNFWIQDASYLRLKNAQIGYTLPKKWMDKVHIQNLRIYVTGENIFTVSHIKGGWDPETTDGSGRIYPVARVISMGLNIKL